MKQFLRCHPQRLPTGSTENSEEPLQQNDPDAWKVILLALGAGLRRAEIDALRWPQINFKTSLLRVCSYGPFETKTEDSEDDVFVDQGLLDELKKFHANDTTDFVVAPKLMLAGSTAAQYYRCQPVFIRVTAWLRKQGIKGDKPLHTLRKEFGSIICASADIYTASRQLRHSNLSTTAAYYLDNRRRVSVPLATLLADEPTKPAPTSPDEKNTAAISQPATSPVFAQ